MRSEAKQTEGAWPALRIRTGPLRHSATLRATSPNGGGLAQSGWRSFSVFMLHFAISAMTPVSTSASRFR